MREGEKKSNRQTLGVEGTLQGNEDVNRLYQRRGRNCKSKEGTKFNGERQQKNYRPGWVIWTTENWGGRNPVFPGWGKKGQKETQLHGGDITKKVRAGNFILQNSTKGLGVTREDRHEAKRMGREGKTQGRGGISRE